MSNKKRHESEPTPDERDDQEDGVSKGISRRDLIRAGWSIPIVITASRIAGASDLGYDDKVELHQDVNPDGGHIDLKAHADRVNHRDSTPHTDGSGSHVDGPAHNDANHIDYPEPHIDSSAHTDQLPHQDYVPHYDTAPHNDQFPYHTDNIRHGDFWNDPDDRDQDADVEKDTRV